MSDSCPLPVPEHLFNQEIRPGKAAPAGADAALRAALDSSERTDAFAATLRQIAGNADRTVVETPQLSTADIPRPIKQAPDAFPMAQMTARKQKFTSEDIPDDLTPSLPPDFDPARIPDPTEEYAEFQEDADFEEAIWEDIENDTYEPPKDPPEGMEPPGPPAKPRDEGEPGKPENSRKWGKDPDTGNLLIRTGYRLERLRYFRGSRFMQMWKRIAYAVGETLQSGRPALPWKEFRDVMIFNSLHRHAAVITTLQIERQLDELLELLKDIPEDYRTLTDIKEMAEAGDPAAQRFMEALGRHINDWEYTINRYRAASVGLISHSTVAPGWLDLLLDGKPAYFARTPNGVIVLRPRDEKVVINGREIINPRQVAEELPLMEGIKGVLEHVAAIARNSVMEQATTAYIAEKKLPLKVKAVVVGGQEVLLPASLADRVARHNHDLGLEKWFNATLPWQLDSALTAASLTGDLSALFNQVGLLMVARPREFARIAMLSLLDIMGNRKAMRKLHARVISKIEKELAARGIDDDPEAFLVSLGLARTGVAEDIAGMNLLYRLPVAGRFFRNANVSFSDILYAARLSLLDQALSSPALRKIEDRETWFRMLHDYIQSVNDLTGTTNVRTTTAEKLVFLASRLVRSQVVTPVLALVPGARGHQARRLLALQLVATAFVSWAWNELNGEETEFNPLKPNWLTMRDVFGNDIRLVPWLGIIPAIAQSVDQGSPDPLANWALWKMRPTLRTVVNAIRKSDTAGMQHPGLSDPELIKHILLNYVPLSFRPMYEDRPGEVGYDLKGRITETVASGLGMPATPLTISERIEKERDKKALERFGLRYDELTGQGKAVINQDPDVKRLVTERKQRNTRLADTYEAERAKRSLEFDQRVEEIERWVKRGRTPDGKIYTKRDAREAINEAYANLLTEQRESDPVLDGYFNLRELARMADGTVNYEMLERLREEYLQAHPGLRAKLDAIEGQYDTPLLAEYRKARELARQYYDIPAYNGMDAEESAIAGRTLALADATVKSGQAMNRAHALDLLVLNAIITPEERTLAIMAVKNKPNPQRKAFAQKNPLFAEWYLGAVEIPSRSVIALGTRGPRTPSEKRANRSSEVESLRRMLRLRPVDSRL